MQLFSPFTVSYIGRTYKVLGVVSTTKDNSLQTAPHFIADPKEGGDISILPAEGCKFENWIEGCHMCGAPRNEEAS